MQIIELKFPLSLEQKTAFKKFLGEKYYPCLEGKDPLNIVPAQIIGGVIYDEGEIKALAFASLYETESQIQFLWASFFDFYEPLLNCLLKQINKSVITLKLARESALYEKLKLLLEKNDWQGPTQHILEYYFKRVLFKPRWFDQVLELPEGYFIVPWKDLNYAALSQIAQKVEEEELFSINPFDEEKGAAINSLALCYNDKVVGWMVAHLLSENMLIYSALYVDKQHRHNPLFLRLLRDSIALHDFSIENGKLEVNLSLISPKWLKFLQNELQPFTFDIKHIDLFWKSI